MTDQKKRRGVVICGSYGLGNAGDEAILKSILQEVRSFAPEDPITVLSRDPAATAAQHGVRAVHMFDLFGLWRAMRDARLYLNGGGSLIQDVTSRRSLWFYLFTLAAAKRLGCKVMMYGCGIGPVNSAAGRKQAARVISRNVDAITLRDAASMEELRNMGVSGPDIALAADPAVTLPAAPPETAEDFLERAGLNPREGQRYLGITVRPWPGFEEKAAAFAAAADFAWEELGLIPVFLPIVGDMDAGAAHTVVSRIQKAPAVILPPCPRTEDTIALFSRMDVVLSMRLHALIFAAGHGVPLVGAVYDPKVSAFLDACGQDLYLPLEEVSAERLKDMLRAAAARREDRPGLEKRTARLLELERVNCDAARRLLAR